MGHLLRTLSARWDTRESRSRLTVLASAIAAVAATAALVAWRSTGQAQYVIQNILPPSLWTLVGIALAHARQMEAHRSAARAAEGHRELAAAAHAEARTARKIMADLYKHQTGLHHPAAPREGM